MNNKKKNFIIFLIYLFFGLLLLSLLFCRFTDFIVNEIYLQGNTVYVHKIDYKQKNEEQILEKKQKKEIFELTNENKEALSNYLEKKDLEKIEIYLQELEAFFFLIIYIFIYFYANSGDKNKSMEIEIPSPDDKEERRKIHETIRNNLKLFDSETVLIFLQSLLIEKIYNNNFFS